MTRKYELEGPSRSKWSLAQVADLLDYEDADSIRRLVAEGRLPRPRGRGESQFYSGLDVAIILEMWGRWEPKEGKTRTGEEQQGRSKTRKDAQEDES